MSSPAVLTLASSIGQIALTVSDLPGAIAFYRDTLGLPFLFEAPQMAFFNCAGVRLMLTMGESGQSRGNSILYFRTENIHTASAELRTRGVALESPAHLVAKLPDHELWMTFFRDSEGNLMALMSEIR